MIYHSIDLNPLYKVSFDSHLIRVTVWPQITPKVTGSCCFSCTKLRQTIFPCDVFTALADHKTHHLSCESLLAGEEFFYFFFQKIKAKDRECAV